MAKFDQRQGSSDGGAILLGAADRRLGLTAVPAHQQFVDGVGTQPGGIVGIWIPASDRHDALGEQFAQLVFDLFRLPLVFQSLSQHGSQSQPSIGSAQQDRPAVGTALSLIKLGHDRTVKNSWEENALCRVMLAQTKASCLVKNCVNNSFFTMKRLFVFLNSRIFQAR